MSMTKATSTSSAGRGRPCVLDPQATDPPPYFPTTGHFVRSHYYPVDPVGFDIQDYFDVLTPEG